MRVEDKIAEELGEKIVKELGAGDFGTVYLLESGKVLKFTSDTSEVIIAKRLTKNKNLFKYILNYYNVGELSVATESKENYFILMDYVEQLTEMERIAINHAYARLLQFSRSFYASAFSPQLVDIVVDKFSKSEITKSGYMTQYSKEQIEKMKKFAISIIPHIQNIAKDLKLHHIETCDFHGGNLGWSDDHSKLIVFDIRNPYIRDRVKIKKYAIFEYVKPPYKFTSEKFVIKFNKFNPNV